LGCASVALRRSANHLHGSFGYLFNAQLAGWRAFCAGFHFDPESCWSHLPGFDTIKRAEQEVAEMAFTPEEVDAYLRRNGRDHHGVVSEAADARAPVVHR
jgi:hypothetical protein